MTVVRLAAPDPGMPLSPYERQRLQEKIAEACRLRLGINFPPWAALHNSFREDYMNQAARLMLLFDKLGVDVSVRP